MTTPGRFDLYDSRMRETAGSWHSQPEPKLCGAFLIEKSRSRVWSDFAFKFFDFDADDFRRNSDAHRRDAGAQSAGDDHVPPVPDDVTVGVKHLVARWRQCRLTTRLRPPNKIRSPASDPLGHWQTSPLFPLAAPAGARPHPTRCQHRIGEELP